MNEDKTLDESREEFLTRFGPVTVGSRAQASEALTALIEEARKVEWLDIESAPRDGTQILCFDPTEHGTVVVLHWLGGRANDMEEGWRCKVAYEFDWEPTLWKPVSWPGDENKDREWDERIEGETEFQRTLDEDRDDEISASTEAIRRPPEEGGR